MNTLVLNKSEVKEKTLYTVLAIVAAVVLPQMVHFIGMISGLGTGVGEIFLPMHLPVFVVGLLAGPVVGLSVGLVSPLISFGLTGMPSSMMLPNMCVELATYGFICGYLANKEIATIWKVGVAMILGRISKAMVIVLLGNLLNISSIPVSLISKSIVTGIPGMLLQISLIPLLMFYIKNKDENQHE